MDGISYTQIIKEFSNNLDVLKKDFEVLVETQYVNENILRTDFDPWDTISGVDKIKNNIYKSVSRFDDLKAGVSKNSRFYHGFDAISREYNHLKTELNLNFIRDYF